MIEQAIRVPAGCSVAFRLPYHLYEGTSGNDWTPSGYTITQELRDWFIENGLVNYRKQNQDIRDYFALSNYFMFLDKDLPDSSGGYIEHYSIAFTHPEHAMGFKLRWL